MGVWRETGSCALLASRAVARKRGRIRRCGSPHAITLTCAHTKTHHTTSRLCSLTTISAATRRSLSPAPSSRARPRAQPLTRSSRCQSTPCIDEGRGRAAGGVCGGVSGVSGTSSRGVPGEGPGAGTGAAQHDTSLWCPPTVGPSGQCAFESTLTNSPCTHRGIAGPLQHTSTRYPCGFPPRAHA